MTVPLELTPLGGLGRIGLNLMLLRTPGARIVIDCGVQFPDARSPGVEFVLPDLGVLAAWAPDAYVLTHAHEDHIGGVPYALRVAPAPVYATPFALGLLRRKLAEQEVRTDVKMIPIGPKLTASIGDVDLEFLRVTHSIPDCVSVVFHTPAGIVIHTGDWKIDREPVDGDEFDEVGFRRVGDRGVLLLMSDSTNAEVPGWSWSERQVGRALEEHVFSHNERVIVSIFASNIHRLHVLAEIAERTGRRLCLVGRSLYRYLEVAREVGRTHIDVDGLVDPNRLGQLAGGDVLVLCTGSQAEPRSALSRASVGMHPHLRIGPGDLVIHSARFIPGNERAIYEMMTNLSRQGARVLHSQAAKVHASGHGYRDEMAHLMNLVRPRYFIPLHGEYSFLRRQADLALSQGVEEVMVVENGQTVEVRPSGMALVGARLLEPYFRDGSITASADAIEIEERLRASRDGVVAVKLSVLRGGERLQADVAVESLGLFSDRSTLKQQCAASLVHGLEALPGFTPLADVREAAEVLVRRFYKHNVGKRPVVMLFVEDVGRTAARAR